MITKNFETIRRFFCCAVATGAGGANLDGVSVVDVTGATKYFRPYSDNSCLPAFLSANFNGYHNSTPGWRFGTGTTPPTENDYQMESLINSGITLSNSTATLKLENSVYKVLRVFNIKNTSNASLTISEIGYIGKQYGSAQQKASASEIGVLYFRDVFTSPIVIAAGETVSINIYIEVPIASE